MTTEPCTCRTWQQLYPGSGYRPVSCFQHPGSQPSTSDDDPVGMTEYIWLGENGANVGDIFALVGYTAMAFYAGLDGAQAVMTFDYDHVMWCPVDVRTEHVVTDGLDYMHHRLICSWGNHTETAIYAIDGRA